MPPDEAPASQSFLADTTHRLNLTDSELVGAGLARRQQLCDQFTAMMVDLETLPPSSIFASSAGWAVAARGSCWRRPTAATSTAPPATR